MTHAMNRPFLVVYDYGGGGLWGLLRARSADDIHRKYPELEIVRERTRWMTDEYFAPIAGDPYDINAEPRDMLRAIIADRERD